ncbi:hypothetical protein [Legionella jordanis]|uniref:Transmembrane protein n=1 Tax=Legionella jordanis TaxID=456 RepID=A0A0W0VBI4_9GAMM|nr:hypothetical protein [Legionella jordanis]KTD17490.1 hypothetical protein Ljor_1796 [Legionella jordanis]RMX05170.1 hypothetical protein EAW55_00445 [Legionella jordanis]RMX17426.1 hypothetical protein EAS68_11075 [Legionella jordanis]VEH13459.1 Uncharacterised protein [Legionella jordanis]HAT8714378.1 hypothetical protein [Legionella jordanis]
MLDLQLSYLTGSAEVVSNHLMGDDTNPRKRRSIGQMFFKPYESKKEFIFCARHTFTPLALWGMTLIDPVGMAVYALGLTAFATGIMLGGLLGYCFTGDRLIPAFCLHASLKIMSILGQGILDMLVLPLSLVIMTTRGISTGLQSAGIYDYDKPAEPVLTSEINMQPI